jgi:hypothetical protein
MARHTVGKQRAETSMESMKSHLREIKQIFKYTNQLSMTVSKLLTSSSEKRHTEAAPIHLLQNFLGEHTPHPASARAHAVEACSGCKNAGQQTGRRTANGNNELQAAGGAHFAEAEALLG